MKNYYFFFLENFVNIFNFLGKYFLMFNIVIFSFIKSENIFFLLIGKKNSKQINPLTDSLSSENNFGNGFFFEES
jgi:hypothetical protein